MRLIDADAFERKIMFGDEEDVQDVIYVLRDFPTAYDIDKVVMKLEKAKDEIASEDYCRSINNKEKCDHRSCFKCCAEYLIEIVKQGGASDDVCEKLVWYRFKTKSVDDYRPLVDMKEIQMPWWCTGTAFDNSYAIIVCYLPKGEDLFKYWNDAYDIDSDERTGITYTDRFTKPKWINEVE